MNTFDALLKIADTLLGPNGCPWDKKQTLDTLKPYLLEEIHELLEAIDLMDKEKIKEELGDCFYTLVFLSKLVEFRKFFTLQEALESIAEKMIRRHPHIFGNVKADSPDEIIQNWEEIKKKEGKTSPLGSIPPSLPALARAQKVIVKLRRAKKCAATPSTLRSEDELGELIWDLVEQAESSGFDAESALRRQSLKREGA
jgi:MazG family protein